jgi:hypothetical protein
MQKPRVELLVALVVAAILALFGLSVLTVIANYASSNPAQLITSEPGASAEPLLPEGPGVTRTSLAYGTLEPLPSLQPSAPVSPGAPTAIATAVQPNTPTPSGHPEAAGKFSIGRSVQGRDIVGYALSGAADSSRALVLVSGIHGDEMNAWPVLGLVLSEFEGGLLARPADLGLYFIESLNPDGTFFEDRLNFHDVDLNRNWDTYDWRTRVQLSPVDFLAAGGGPHPFSEPETSAMRDWLLALQARHTGGVTGVYFHAAVPPDGLVTPGTHFTNGRDLADTPSRELGQVMARVAGYEYSNQWVGGYTVTGDASTWAVAQGMRSITVELPMREPLDSTATLNLRAGILALVDFVSR